MDCNDIQDIKKLVAKCQSEDEQSKEEAFECFYRWYLDWEGLARSIIYKVLNHPRSFDKIDIAYADGCLAFFIHVVKKGFEEKGATVKTVLFTFCKFKLLGELKKLKSELKKEGILFTYLPQSPDDRDNEMDQLSTDLLEFIEPEEVEILDEETIYEMGLKLLDQRSFDVLIWRKVEGLSDKEIAAKHSIIYGPLSSGSVANTVYTCAERLRELVVSIKRIPHLAQIAMEMLPEKCRNIFMWQREDITEQEIARRLDIKPDLLNNESTACKQSFNEYNSVISRLTTEGKELLILRKIKKAGDKEIEQKLHIGSGEIENKIQDYLEGINKEVRRLRKG